MNAPSPDPNSVLERYAEGLGRHLGHPGEQTLEEAYLIGRDAAEQDVGILDLASCHHEVLADWLEVHPTLTMSVLEAAAEFFLEATAVMEMSYRGYRDANRQLRNLNQQLDTARQIAEEQAEAKSRLLANMSHEIRTPLSAILGFARLLIRLGGLKGRSLGFAERIFLGGQHLECLVSDILDLSKLSAGRLHIKPVLIDCGELIGEVVALNEALVEECGLTLSAQLRDGPLHAMADPLRLRQILFNIISNAIKYTHPGGNITVGLWREGDQVAFEVRDTGVGLAPHDVERIFSEYEQVHSPVQNGARSTGLGLTITRQLVRLHDGRIEVDSALGEGTALRVLLPLIEAT